MEIKRAGSQPSAKGSLEWFTGTVRVDPLFQVPDPARVSGASVTFEPGARTRQEVSQNNSCRNALSHSNDDSSSLRQQILLLRIGQDSRSRSWHSRGMLTALRCRCCRCTFQERQ
jgi:hypothetical protein